MSNYIDELLVDTLISAHGCPEPMIERALRSAMVDFYRDSKAWRLTTDVLSVIAGNPEVELELPENTFVSQVYWAKLDGKVLRAVSPRNVSREEGTPGGYAINGITRVLLLDCKPTESYITNGVEVNVAILPLPTLDEIPDELFAIHRDGILWGAIAKLLAMPNVPWADLNGSIIYANMSANIRMEARRQAESHQAPVVRVVKYGGIL